VFEQYVKTAARLPDLLRAVEEYLAGKQDGVNIAVSELASADPQRLASKDEVLAIAAALADLGIISTQNSGFVVNACRLLETVAFRSGVAEAIKCVSNHPSTVSTLCVALPPDFAANARDRVYEIAVDLRAAILDVIASAESRLVLASPFWDSETLSELTPLLERRMESGVDVTALGRFRQKEMISLSANLQKLMHHPNFRAVSWFNVVNGAVSTFHFKTVIADGGQKAYLGTANLTASGLRSRLEVGSIWSGDIAHGLAALVDTVISIGSTVQLADWNAY